MSINKNISDFIRRYKDEHQMSISEIAEELSITRSSVQLYLKGQGNPRADTLDLLAEKCGVSAAEIISAPAPGWERAETVERVARLFGDLPLEQRERIIPLFLALVDILAGGDHN